MLALLILAALVTAGPPWRRILGFALAVTAVLWGATTDGGPMLRGVVALYTFWAAARVLDLAREPRPLSPAHRIAHVFVLLDTRALTRVRKSFDRRGLLAGLLWFDLCILARHGAEHFQDLLPLRWALGALFVYAVAEAVHNLAHALLAGLGLRAPPLHRRPIAAGTLREFWGDRWNLVVGRWLRAHFFMPMARRRRPRLGLALAFVASTGLHAWCAGVALGPRMAASMGGFFLIQALLIGLEQRLGVDRWPEPAAWAWTMACVLVPSPLFTEPLLRVFEAARVAVV